MEGYFNIKVKFVIAVLLAVLFYVSYLYVFREQSPAPFKLTEVCTEKQIKDGTVKANLFFERYFEEKTRRNPEQQTKLGRKENNDKWTSLTTEYYELEQSFNQAMLHYLEDSILLVTCMDQPTELSAVLLKNRLELALDGYPFRYHNYPINPVTGEHLKIPNFLINRHNINDLQDAETYIRRVKGVREKIEGLIDQLEVRRKKRIILPKFLFPKILQSIDQIVKDEKDKPNVILADFTMKINQLEIEAKQKEILYQRLEEVFKDDFVAAYQNLYTYLISLEKEATNDIGIWRWAAGKSCYAFRLREKTTTSLTADEIYDLGIEEVARIQEEMRRFIGTLNFEGNLQDFFDKLRTDDQFYYPNTEEGRKAYLDEVKEILDSIRLRLDEMFITIPSKELIVRPLEPFREKSTFQTFYTTTVLGSDQPGIHYVNVHNMRQLPKYTLEAMAYHEGLPGHYLQESIEESLVHLPQFRRFEDTYTAYIEGWAMYAEHLPKEVGAYQDPYSDFGRLVLELWRACRLVVDVGIHHKKWTREEAINYYKENTPSQESRCVKMVDRHIVLPAQATTYKIGIITILELRKQAKLELGAKFDIREFHEVLLTNGAVPLEVLQDLVEEYIQTKKG